MQPKKEDGVFFFNQWKIGLQCCVGFCQTTSQIIHNYIRWAPLVAQLVKNPSAMQETPVRFLDPEDPLEKGYSGLISFRIDWLYLLAVQGNT